VKEAERMLKELGTIAGVDEVTPTRDRSQEGQLM
jgi:hypothetical protein